MSEEVEERGLAGAVWSKDGGVFAAADGQCETVEYRNAALDDRCIGQFKKRRLQP